MCGSQVLLQALFLQNGDRIIRDNGSLSLIAVRACGLRLVVAHATVGAQYEVADQPVRNARDQSGRGRRVAGQRPGLCSRRFPPGQQHPADPLCPVPAAAHPASYREHQAGQEQQAADHGGQAPGALALQVEAVCCARASRPVGAGRPVSHRCGVGAAWLGRAGGRQEPRQP